MENKTLLLAASASVGGDSKAPVNPTLCQHFLHGTPTKMFAGSANGQMVEVFYCRCRLCDDLFILGRSLGRVG